MMKNLISRFQNWLNHPKENKIKNVLLYYDALFSRKKIECRLRLVGIVLKVSVFQAFFLLYITNNSNVI